MTSLVTLLAGACVLAAVGEDAAVSAESARAHVRAALHWAAPPGALEVHGQLRHHGVEGEYRLVFDGSGRFYREVTGLLAEKRGFDGETCWIHDYSHATRRLDGADREACLISVWFETGSWLEAPLELTSLPDRTNDRQVALSVRLRNGETTGRLFIDRASWRPQRLEWPVHSSLHVWSLDDYRPGPGGVLLAHRVTHKADKTEDSGTVSQVGMLQGPASDLFRYRAQPPDNVTFDGHDSHRLAVRRLKTGHLAVQPRINGQDVGWWILDTGAGMNAIDRSLADRLGLEAFGKVAARGVGGSTINRFRKDKSLALGPVTLRDNVYVDLDLRAIGAIMGTPIGGIVGYQLFEAAVVEIDVATPAIRLFDPATYRLTRGQWEPLVLQSNLPCIPARFAGGDGLFRLDTGSMNTVSFHVPAVERLGLLKGRSTSLTLEGGVGGVVGSRRGRLDWFELAGHRFAQPQVTFSQAKTGALMDPSTAGTLGQGFLRPFRVVLWYQQNRIALVPITLV